MRRSLLALVISAASGLFGCASGGNSSSQPAHAEKKADTKPFAMQADGKDVLLLDVPKSVRCRPKGDMVVFAVFGHDASVWMLRDAKSIDDGIARINDTVKGEFKEFAPSTTKEITIAGNPAKELSGPGKEADDNDPANGVAVVFKADGHIFIGLAHGEHFAQSDRDWMMAIVETAKAP